jgi:hypothetical protein
VPSCSGCGEVPLTRGRAATASVMPPQYGSWADRFAGVRVNALICRDPLADLAPLCVKRLPGVAF